MILRFLRDETGSSTTEYALMTALAGGGVSLAALTLGGMITQAISSTDFHVDNGGGQNAGSQNP
jgi:Flp pilus assembly pilin Flp